MSSRSSSLDPNVDSNYGVFIEGIAHINRQRSPDWPFVSSITSSVAPGWVSECRNHSQVHRNIAILRYEHSVTSEGKLNTLSILYILLCFVVLAAAVVNTAEDSLTACFPYLDICQAKHLQLCTVLSLTT